jgi:hypothetical protein
MSSPTKRHPIEVRYFSTFENCWVQYSRHRSLESARRAFVELCNASPEYEVQMRNDIEGRGVIDARYPTKRKGGGR